LRQLRSKHSKPLEAAAGLHQLAVGVVGVAGAVHPLEAQAEDLLAQAERLDRKQK